MGRPKTVQRIKFNCQYCNIEVEERKTKFDKRKRFNCSSKECVKMAKSHPGHTNGMYGKTHTEEIKRSQAQRAKDTHSGISYVERYGIEKTDELKKIRSQTFKKTWENPDRTLSFLGKSHSEETKNVISKKSSEKFTIEFKERIYYSTGLWTRPEEKSDFEIYSELSNWIKPMWDIAENKELLEHGIWHAIENPNGVVRDHMVSRKFGFDNLIFPEILRHPANCYIMFHKNNSSKGPKSSLTLYELFDKIKKYQGDWYEHNFVLEKIKLYENGNFWNRKEVVSE